MSLFNPTDPGICAPKWEMYMRDFLIHLDAWLHDKPGRRKVGVLSFNTGREAVKIYYSFEFSPVVHANKAAVILDRAAKDRYNLETVLKKFDLIFWRTQKA